MNKTAVDFLIEEMQKVMMPEQMADMEWPIFIAKKREKQQIVDAHLTGLIYPLEIEATKQAEQYYNETYGGAS
jgi:hypothetical protein